MSRYFSGYLRKGIIIISGVIFAVPCVLLINKLARADTRVFGGQIIENKCSRCHSPDRFNLLKKDKDGWDMTINRMREKDKDWLSKEEAQACADFLKNNCVVRGKELFVPMCLSCHGEMGKENLLYQSKTKDSWIRSIERMRRKFNFLIGIDEAEEIAKFWTDPENNKNLKLTSDPDDISEGVFEEKCSRCHTYGFLHSKKKNKQGWLDLLTRMRAKSPVWISDEDSERIKDYILLNEKFLIK